MYYRQPFTGTYPITQKYGDTDTSAFHTGIDYGCPTGTPILASEAGTVKFAGWDTTGYGNCVILQHADGNATLYAHLQSIVVKTGQKVERSQVIGYSDSTGNSTGPHLHFEMRSDAQNFHTAFDPKTKLQSVLDTDPINNTTAPVKPQFEPVESGFCIVCCEAANVRCHCDMARVMGQRKKGDVIAIGDEVTMYNGLPYRDYYDPEFKCWLRIAEHDPTTQIIKNYDGIK